MTDVAQQVDEELAGFRTSADTDRLRAALAGIERLAAQDVQPALLVELWLRALRAIDRVLEPDWDPSEVPSTSVIPPPSGGVSLPSGVAPPADEDPQARAAYEKARADAAEAAERYAFQLDVHRADERAVAGLARAVGDPGDPVLLRRLARLLAEQGSPGLRTRVQAALGRDLGEPEGLP